MADIQTGALHHVEIWVPNFERAAAEWGWLLTELGYAPCQEWAGGCSWRLGATYIVVEKSPALTGSVHRRTDPGLNHLAFHAGNRAAVDGFWEAAPHHGWDELFPEKYPHAGGPGSHAAYMVNTDGFEIELVASD